MLPTRLGRRVKKHIDTAAPAAPDGIDTYQHMYYTTGWQLIETRETDTESTAPDTLAPEYQFVWSTRYIDSPVLRDDFTVYGVMDGRIYYLTDANFNVTALVDEVEVDSWQVVERYAYDAYGAVIVNTEDGPYTVLDADWSPDDDGVSDYDNAILFAGYYYDWETGLYHVRRRPYHGFLGRWTARDIIEYGDGMSLYEYVASRPSDYRDPSGRANAGAPKDSPPPKQIDDDAGDNVKQRGVTWKPLGEGKPRPERGLEGRSFFAKTTNRGILVEIWKPDPDQKQDYWCHGFTFGGHQAKGGPYSLFGIWVIPILRHEGWGHIPCSFAQPREDIVVFISAARGGVSIKHSGVVWGRGACSLDKQLTEDTMMIKSKWELAPLSTDSLADNADEYGKYACFSLKGPARKQAFKGTCPCWGRREWKEVGF